VKKIKHYETVRVTINAHSKDVRIDPARVDASTEHDITRQMVEDEKGSMLDSAKYAQRMPDDLQLF